METNFFVQLILIIKLESNLHQDREFSILKRALPTHIKTADEIRACANRNFQNKYLEIFLNNLLQPRKKIL